MTEQNNEFMEVGETADETANTSLNSSYSSRWLGKSHDENAVGYTCRNANALINKCPTETWVECMKFLNRDNLQSMQLVSNRFDLIVEKYFGIYPLRRVDWCKVRTTWRSKSMKALLICLDTGRTIETNSDLHLWLQNSMVDCIEFIDFKFDYELLIHLTNMDPKLFRLNYAVFDYRRKASEEPISAQHISYLFSIKAFETCTGVVFSFENRCAMFRPQIFDLLKLPQKTLVIDFDDYEPSVQDNQAISSWLNDGEAISINKSKCEPKELSIKGFNYEETIQNLIEVLRRDFFQATKKQSYILNIEWSEEMDLEQKVDNLETGEKFMVRVFDRKMVVRRE